MDAKCEELGLKQPPESGAEYLGRVEFDDGSWADVTVNTAPGKFWDFAVWTVDGNRLTHVQTGTGDLAEFWPTIEMIAEGMLVAYLAPYGGYVQPFQD
jgi:hypothetical protein